MTDEASDDPVIGPPAEDAPVAYVADDGPTVDLSGLDPDDSAASDLVVLEWTCEAVLIELGVRLGATLDTSSATSTWYTDRSDTQDVLTVAIGAVRGVVRFAIVPAAQERLVLGRDFLADRVLVRS